MCSPTGCWENPPSLLQKWEQQSGHLHLSDRNIIQDMVQWIPVCFLRTWVGCRHSGRQSWYCGRQPCRREARGCPHPSTRVDTLLAPVARRAGAHARTRGVRWRWRKSGAMLWLVGVVSILRMVQSFLIRWRIINFRRHALAGPPWRKDMWWAAALDL